MIRKAKVEGGVVVGIPAADPRITAFKGIPFAAPPVGENRWRAPQPVIPWEGERKCWTFAPISMQHIPGLDLNNIYSREWNVDPEIPMDEDCLYLNVWTPAKSTDEKLPVFVWFFGGGLREGNPAEMEFDGERIARRGIVVVTVNYRLNVFGFLSHPQLEAEQPDAPANFGHLDQRAGIIWAKNNIEAFGGDPNNITIGGQSAGGGSTCAQMGSLINEGLFQKAIIMSGTMTGVYGSRAGITYEEAQKQGEDFFKYLGVSTLEEARKIDAVTLRDKCEAYNGRFSTVVDNKFIDGHFVEKMVKGDHMKMPIIIGNTSTEFRTPLAGDNMEEFRENAKKALGPQADEFLKACGDDFEEAKKKSAVCGFEMTFRAMKEKDKEQGIDYPTYYYVFNPEIPGWDNPGTFHSSDLWFFFENLAKCWRPFKGNHYDLSRQMCNYWCNFMKTGDPNGADNDGTPMETWKKYSIEEPNAMWFNNDGPKLEVTEPSDVLKPLVENYKSKL
ncbi:MAG: carboxylesterase family protein [Eubacteriales bacterium]|nr:carboxylesterase family protein [Eubacteriales bacterium]